MYCYTYTPTLSMLPCGLAPDPVVYGGTLRELNALGEVVLKGVSHLDAFSGYLFQT